MGIYNFKQRDAPDKPDNIRIVLEGPVVLQEMDNVALAAVLFVLMHALNLNPSAESIQLKCFRRLSWSWKATRKPRSLKTDFISEPSCFGIKS